MKLLRLADSPKSAHKFEFLQNDSGDNDAIFEKCLGMVYAQCPNLR